MEKSRPRGRADAWSRYVLLFASVLGFAAGLDAQTLACGFVENRGQWDPSVRFVTRHGGLSYRFAPDGLIVDAIRSHKEYPGSSEALRVHFVDASPNVTLEGSGASSTNQFYLGRDRSQWTLDVPGFEALTYRALYPGIDLIYRRGDAGLKYELRLAPGVATASIRLRYTGVTGLERTSNGELALDTAWGRWTESAPIAYQELAQGRVPVEARYRLWNANTVGFELGPLPEPSAAVVIDPALGYGTFLGGASFDQAEAVAVDRSGRAHVTGGTASPDFPASGGPIPNNNYVAYVSRAERYGRDLEMSVFLGGSGTQLAYAIAIDPAGNIAIAGDTDSADFPVTSGAYDETHNAQFQGQNDVFVAKFSPTGALLYCTFLGGTESEIAENVAFDDNGNIVVLGYTGANDFPTTSGAFDETWNGWVDVFVAVLAPLGQGSADLLYSTVVGGNEYDVGHGLQLVDGDIVFCGETRSPDFPTTTGPGPLGGFDAFVARIHPAGQGLLDLVYSRRHGGTSHDYGNEVVVDSLERPYVAGITLSTDLPTTLGAYQEAHGGDFDAFLTRFTSDATTIERGTFLGDAERDGFVDAKLDSHDRPILAGTTHSPLFPTTPDAHDTTLNGQADIFFAAFSDELAALQTSTVVGGASDDLAVSMDVDRAGSWYVTGTTEFPSDFPTTRDAFDTTFGGGFIDGYLAKVCEQSPFRFGYDFNASNIPFNTAQDVAVMALCDVPRFIFVTVPESQRVVRFSIDANNSIPVLEFPPALSPIQDGPLGVAVNDLPDHPSYGLVFVTDLDTGSGFGRLKIYDWTGCWRADLVVDTSGGNPTFVEPVGVAVDERGHVYVVDRTLERAYRFDSALFDTLPPCGTPVSYLAPVSTTYDLSTIGPPTDISVDVLGRVHVSFDDGGGTAGVVVFSNDGSTLWSGPSVTDSNPQAPGIDAKNLHADTWVSTVPVLAPHRWQLPAPVTIAYPELTDNAWAAARTGIETQNHRYLRSGKFSNPRRYRCEERIFAAGPQGVSVFERTHHSTPRPLGAVGWWPFNEISGLKADDFLHSFSADLVGSPPPGHAPGVVSCSLRFDGNGEYVLAPDRPALNFDVGDFTAECWIRALDFPGEQVFLEKRGDLGWRLYLENGYLGILLQTQNGTEAFAPAVATNFVADGHWHHIAAVVDRTSTAPEVRLYVDGKSNDLMVDPSPLAGSVDPGGEPIYIGAANPTFADVGLFGALDEVTLYDRALGEAEVVSIFCANCGGKDQPPWQPQVFEVQGDGPFVR